MSEEKAKRVRVWDAPTRLFHWLAVALIALAYATAR
jgi:cytochrome b